MVSDKIMYLGHQGIIGIYKRWVRHSVIFLCVIVIEELVGVIPISEFEVIILVLCLKLCN